VLIEVGFLVFRHCSHVLYPTCSAYVLGFLAHKADFIGKGIFDKIHQIRKADVTSVTEALNLVDDGGYWKRRRATILE
jgi:hypothetical protein